MERPQTSRPRGICKYYKTQWGCMQGDRCKFLHGESQKLTPYDEGKTCRYFAKGYCKHGTNCWFRHVLPDSSAAIENAEVAPRPSSPEEALMCCICLEPPATFGLLSSCSHIFCVDCIRKWRDKDTHNRNDDILESLVNKACPYCRTHSKMIIPSSLFYPDGHPGKAATIEKYKASTARTHCKYFGQSKSDDRCCPFGRDCLYKHANEDGTPYVFEAGVDFWMNEWNRRYRKQHHFNASDRFPFALNYLLDNSFIDVNRYMDDIRDVFTRIPTLDDTARPGIDGAQDGGRQDRGLHGLGNQLIANLNAAMARLVGEPTPSMTNPTPASAAAPRPASAPLIASDAHDRRDDADRRRPIHPASGRRLRPASLVLSDNGSLPSLETISDSSFGSSDDNRSFDDSDPPAEDEGDRDRHGAISRIELGGVAEAIQSISVGGSDPMANREQDEHSGQRSDDGSNSNVDDVPSDGAEESGIGLDFRELPPPSPAMNSDEDEEALPTGVLTALAAMSEFIGSGPAMEFACGMDDGEEEDRLDPVADAVHSTASPQVVVSSTAESAPTPVVSHIDIDNSSPSIPAIPTAHETAVDTFISSDLPEGPSHSVTSSTAITIEPPIITSTLPIESPADVAATTALQTSTESAPDPPFMTDGRGRVVWSRAGSKSGPSSISTSSNSAGRGSARTAASRRPTERVEASGGERAAE